MKTILIGDALSEAQGRALNTKLAGSGSFEVVTTSDRKEWAKRVQQAHVLIVRDEEISGRLIHDASCLELILHLTPGQGGVDSKAATARGIEVDTLVNAGLLGVAEHTILLMLSLVKNLPEVHRRTAESLHADSLKPTVTTQKDYTFNWSGVRNMDVLYRRTLGLIGLGTIGRLVARRARAFEMDVIYYDIQRLSEEAETRLGVCFVPFDDLLANADFVSLHTRVTPETEKFINAEVLAKMKSSAYLINTARGRLVDEDALDSALSRGVIAGAGLDVFWKEPPEKSNPLLSRGNVVLTSHCAGIFNDDAESMEVDFIARKIRTLCI